MKYIIPQDKIDKIAFRYLDMYIKGLERRNAKHYEGIVYGFPDEEYGILGYENDGTFYIYYDLIDEISSNLGLKESDIKSVITRWATDRLQLDVINTIYTVELFSKWLSIDYN